MTRRILVVEFNHRVKRSDTTLGKRMKSRLAATMHKCRMAYQQLIYDCGSSSLWEKLPEYFLNTRKNLSSMINPLEDFLNNGEQVRVDQHDPDCYMPLEQFRDLYFAFAKKHQYGVVKLHPDQYTTTFETFGIIVKQEAEKEYLGQNYVNCKWLLGVGPKEDLDPIINNHP